MSQRRTIDSSKHDLEENKKSNIVMEDIGCCVIVFDGIEKDLWLLLFCLEVFLSILVMRRRQCWWRYCYFALELFVFLICRIWHWHCGGVGVLNEKAWIEYVFGIGIEEDLWHLRLVIATDIAAIVAATAIFINIWCWRGLFACSKSAFMDKREQIWNQKNHKIHQRRYCFCGVHRK
eukprot:468948_1